MVNVTDFKNMIPPGDMLVTVFDRQTQLIEKYHHIEQRALGMMFPLPGNVYDLQNPKHQFRLKDFAWRITEEITEATECSGQDDKTHFLEELIDAMHFFVEMLIYIGFKPLELTLFCGIDNRLGGDCFEHFWAAVPVESVLDMRIVAYEVIEYLGKAMNCLKNKPWKQTHMTTDEKAFKENIAKAWLSFVCLLKVGGYFREPAAAVLLYLDKNDVNKFRIRSAY